MLLKPATCLYNMLIRTDPETIGASMERFEAVCEAILIDLSILKHVKVN